VYVEHRALASQHVASSAELKQVVSAQYKVFWFALARCVAAVQVNESQVAFASQHVARSVFMLHEVVAQYLSAAFPNFALWVVGGHVRELHTSFALQQLDTSVLMQIAPSHRLLPALARCDAAGQV
jgi:hypothetical protein